MYRLFNAVIESSLLADCSLPVIINCFSFLKFPQLHVFVYLCMYVYMYLFGLVDGKLNRALNTTQCVFVCL